MKKIVFALLLAISCTMTVQAQLIKAKGPVDAKYAAGTVPVVNGRVELSRTIDLSNVKHPDSIYAKLPIWLGTYHTVHEILDEQVISRDAAAKRLEVGLVEYLVFKNSALVFDRTQIIYHLTFQQKGNQLFVTMSNIRYYYDENRTPIKYKAEEWITDEMALNSKKTKFAKGGGKFRVKTIDHFDMLCESIKSYIDQQ